jgi:hypothetical protein
LLDSYNVPDFVALGHIFPERERKCGKVRGSERVGSARIKCKVRVDKSGAGVYKDVELEKWARFWR